MGWHSGLTLTIPSLIHNWSLIYLQFSFIGGVWDGNHLECTTSVPLHITLLGDGAILSLAHPLGLWGSEAPGLWGGRCKVNSQAYPPGWSYPLTNGVTTHFTMMEWVKTLRITSNLDQYFPQVNMQHTTGNICLHVSCSLGSLHKERSRLQALSIILTICYLHTGLLGLAISCSQTSPEMELSSNRWCHHTLYNDCVS